MIVNINNKEIELKYGFRAMMIYEEITDSTFGADGKAGVKEMLTMFYSVVLASYPELPIKFDDFINWCDDNKEVFNDFCKWFILVNSDKLPKKAEPVTPVEEKKNNKRLKKA